MKSGIQGARKGSDNGHNPGIGCEGFSGSNMKNGGFWGIL
ncbi:hypothetical protein SAMN04487894_11146 [Niabella drilacis]|uniref:Uncharacterized protein n=1 Tax=Niabella drilacis (strain DSM 25811 / CCM 8410 / CCUG 62505 / LMG 26954 / E90) TaxID=1285928 RepID=A0A1G6WAU8_NIADE|nr:hypothetical protein SAMN04487894_11146 [Niabella drilacis]